MYTHTLAILAVALHSPGLGIHPLQANHAAARYRASSSRHTQLGAALDGSSHSPLPGDAPRPPDAAPAHALCAVALRARRALGAAEWAHCLLAGG